MILRLIATLCVCGSVLMVSGCKTNDTQQPTAAVTTKITRDKPSQPSPKPRPKTEPQYPSAGQLIAWHANQCGGFKLAVDNKAYIGEKELKNFFHFMCLNSASDPNSVMNKLLKLDQAYYWPDAIKQYLWLQKQQITLQITVKKEQQALHEKMQQTLSSLAAIEQQLLLREETKEQ
ncbi:hypothetical protein [Pseudoalteromonas sp.]|uniref:hypothetical protein n=1 Tax=Pseudoalteromonas sp. TaxID=53249 RepID=UPI0035616768